MAYNATIAGQIQRIQDATNLLRNVITEKWEVANIDTTRLDDIADRYNEIPVISGNVFIPIQIETDGITTVAASAPITNGYYKNVSIKPFVKVENVDDIIINVENKKVTLAAISGTIEPTTVLKPDGKIDVDQSYNYLQSVSYTIKPVTVPTEYTKYGDGLVTINFDDYGWIASKEYSFTGAKASVVLDGNEIGGATKEIKASQDKSQTLVVNSGIRRNKLTVTIPAVTASIDGTATADDIVKDKIAWTVAGRITGKVPDKRDTTTGAEWVDDTTGTLIIKPAPGCYNDASRISTNITVGEAIYTLTGHETVEEFEITPSSDEDENITTYLTKVKINNGAIYSALAAI